jgi:hypothetical protein
MNKKLFEIFPGTFISVFFHGIDLRSLPLTAAFELDQDFEADFEGPAYFEGPLDLETIYDFEGPHTPILSLNSSTSQMKIKLLK